VTDRERERMERLLLDIRSQATRKRRASALKLMQKGRTS
jgi:hypothetical protein